MRTIAGRLGGFIAVSALLVAWEVGTVVLQTPRYLVPAPTVIVDAALQDGARLLPELGRTLVEALAGFAIGSLVAILLAVAVQRSRTFELAALPPLMVLQSVPIVAVTPVIALVVGRNMATAVVIAAIICFFPVTVNALRGLRSVSDESLELMHVLAAPGWRVLRSLQFPASLPHLFGGLRVAATLCLPGAMIAEWLAADRGLGYYIIDMQVRFRTELVWAGIMVATLTSVALFTVVTIVERILVGWHAAATSLTGE
jgi:NitT/TauT family transport system permease protein